MWWGGGGGDKSLAEIYEMEICKINLRVGICVIRSNDAQILEIQILNENVNDTRSQTGDEYMHLE